MSSVTFVARAATADVDWFPQQHSQTFFVIKGLLSMVAVAMLLFHMDHAWKTEALTLGRRLRYLSLFYFAAVIAGHSAEQVQHHARVGYGAVSGLVGAVLLIAAMAYSIREARK